MTVETETAILKALDKLEQKLDKFIETTNQKFDGIQKDITDLKVGQAEVKGELKILQLINGALFISFIGAIVKLVFFPNA